MQGAHCPVCRERGPDVVVEPQELPLPEAEAPVRGALELTCGHCGARWRWTLQIVPAPAGGWAVRYGPVVEVGS